MFRNALFGSAALLVAAAGALLPTAAGAAPVAGFTLTEIGDHLYDASTDPAHPTEAQQIVDKLYALGVRHINLSPRAHMTDPRGSTLVPYTPSGPARSDERRRYLNLMRYIHGKGMTVGIRPIFFVEDANGNVPYRETLADGTVKVWWHGNIQPSNPNAWFESFRTYLDIYMAIAKVGQADEFTLGAELYSMTVGIEDQWLAYPYGFPGRWLELLRYARTQLGARTRIMYDINFTDDKIAGGQLDEFGGEFARWRYRLVDLANPSDPAQRQIWQDLVDFWNGLDAVGIDMYRSLVPARDTPLPPTYDGLVDLLNQGAGQYASQIDNAMFQIMGVTGTQKSLIFKEVGFKSVDHGFFDPFVYSGAGALNVEHQAAAFDATFQSFWTPGWDWFGGIVFWDASVDPALHGANDLGFSPIGKAQTENVLKRYFQAQ
jgi:hypothetical protein